MCRTAAYIMLALLPALVFALAPPVVAQVSKPYVLVQYVEDQQNRSQGRVHTRSLDLEFKLNLVKSGRTDEFLVESVSLESARGREVVSKTSGSEVYVVSGATARISGKVGRVILFRDKITRQVIAVNLPLISTQVNWQGPWGQEPADKMVIGPVSTSASPNGAAENQPARPDGPSLPQWLIKAGVHPDFAVDTCPDTSTFLGGGAWLREEPERVWEKTYSWELVLPE